MVISGCLNTNVRSALILRRNDSGEAGQWLPVGQAWVMRIAASGRAGARGCRAAERAALRCSLSSQSDQTPVGRKIADMPWAVPSDMKIMLR
jgi:hypothetical protein